jgi:hypothetical protein
MEAAMAPVSQAPRRYFIEFNAAMLLYIATVIGREHLVQHVTDPILKTLVLLSPIPFVCLAAIAVVRFYRRIDEYHRLQLLESLAISTGVTAVVTTSWMFLQDVGFPPLSIFYAWPAMAVIWGILVLTFAWKDKVSEGVLLRALKSVAATLVYVAVGTAVYALVAGWAGWWTHWAILALVATVLFIARMGFFIFAKTSKSC